MLGASYNFGDMVTYNGTNYVRWVDVESDSSRPDTSFAYWKPVSSKGEWIAGSGYNDYDLVTYSGTSYVCRYAISSGKGLDLVRVVPNPYDIRGRFMQFGDRFQYDRIAFYGLPPICKLKIFTERGDLVWELEHTKGTGSELWDSLTSSGQIIASGIYILYVEVPDGRSVIRKFVVIR